MICLATPSHGVVNSLYYCTVSMQQETLLPDIISSGGGGGGALRLFS